LPSGRFIAVVGPSGAGKDSLIAAARDRLGADGQIRFVRRAVTRPADAGGEDHRALSEAAFTETAARGGFVLHWAAHGLRYGIPADVLDDLAAGRSVLANLSRGAIPDVRSRFPNRRIILVTASPDVLAARLADRGRETAREIAARLARAPPHMPDGPDVVTVVNDGALEDGARAFLDAIG
jgi:phosphonate metabolism protein PhnN/1,5-bisphosphokinase (PRPP-forming)